MDMEVFESLGNIQNLPDELLVEIFQYISLEELVLSVQNVCLHWRAVTKTLKLWRYHAYKPSSVNSDEEVIAMLKRMPLLRAFVFNARGLKIDEIIDVLCSHCKYIHTLICDQVFITTAHMRKIKSSLHYIEFLHLSQWQMMDDISLYYLGKLQNLKKLTCVNVGPASIYINPDKKVFQRLEHIEIIAYCTGDVIVREDERNEWDPFHFLYLVPHLTNLKHLSIDFRMLQFSGFESVFTDIKYLSNLETLRFRSLFHADQQILTKMFEVCFFQKLQKLDLGNCLNINVKTVRAIHQSCPVVKELRFYRCINFDDKCAKALTLFNEVHSLDLSCCNRVTEYGLAYLALCPKLQVLDLSWRHVVPRVTFRVLATIPHLTTLTLNYTQIIHSDLEKFLSRNKNVVNLELYCCDGVDVKVLKDLVPHCKINCSHIQEGIQKVPVFQNNIMNINKQNNSGD